MPEETKNRRGPEDDQDSYAESLLLFISILVLLLLKVVS
jgi:hypothetical protein